MVSFPFRVHLQLRVPHAQLECLIGDLTGWDETPAEIAAGPVDQIAVKVLVPARVEQIAQSFPELFAAQSSRLHYSTPSGLTVLSQFAVLMAKL
jgi:hypothetical protein